MSSRHLVHYIHAFAPDHRKRVPTSLRQKQPLKAVFLEARLLFLIPTPSQQLNFLSCPKVLQWLVS
jgi:hypothetical protein